MTLPTPDDWRSTCSRLYAKGGEVLFVCRKLTCRDLLKRYEARKARRAKG